MTASAPRTCWNQVKTARKGKTLAVRHIGAIYALCDRRKRANLRPDLGAERYRQLGVKERFKNEDPYHICLACIKRADHWWDYTYGKPRHAASKKRKGTK